jgi:hypothetical protein
VALLIAAEAWVFWVNITFGTGMNEWAPTGSFRTLESCNAAVAQTVQTIPSPPDFSITARKGNMVQVRSKDGTEGAVHYVCLPANIDPRK